MMTYDGLNWGFCFHVLSMNGIEVSFNTEKPTINKFKLIKMTRNLQYLKYFLDRTPLIRH